MKAVFTLELTIDEEKLKELGITPRDLITKKYINIIPSGHDGVDFVPADGVLLAPTVDIDYDGKLITGARVISSIATRFDKHPVAGPSAAIRQTNPDIPQRGSGLLDE